MSTKVAIALEMQGHHYTSSTIQFVKMFDKVFDCLNVSRLNQDITARKPALAPYRSTDDWRFEVIETYYFKVLN